MRAGFIAILAMLAAARAATADEIADIAEARNFAGPALIASCEFRTEADGSPAGDNQAFSVKYRTPWQDQDSPDVALTLVQLQCSSKPGNTSSVFVARDGSGRWSLLSFPEPLIDYDYADEAFTRLKGPPRVAGYAARSKLMNAEFVPGANTIVATAKWQGSEDAWSAGRWALVDGEFVLVRYEVDPTFDGSGGNRTDAGSPQSYVVFDGERR